MIEDPTFAAEKLRRITQLEPVVRECRNGWMITAVDLNEGRVVLAIDSTLKACVDRFLIENLRQIGVILLRRQHGKCANCGSRTALQRDHKIRRSEERLDTVANIEMLCPDCHELKHNWKDPTAPPAAPPSQGQSEPAE